jgi:ribonucleoside-triphosphate reductase
VLAPFVTASFAKHRKVADEWQIPDADSYAHSRTEKECYDAFQSLEYEVNTLPPTVRPRSSPLALVWAPVGNRA